MTTTLWHYGSVRILRWGNGLGLRIPLTLARRAGLHEGTIIDIRRQGRRIVLEPRPDTPTLEDLLAHGALGTIPEEIEWRRPDRSHPREPG